MEECLDIGTIDDILNFNSDDDEHKPPFSEQEEEELEWISNFPPVDEYVLAAGGKEKHHSPVSVLENSTSSNTSNVNSGSVVMNCCGGLRVPARARSQRCRKRRKCFTGILRQQFLVSQESVKKRSRGGAALRTPILGRKCLHCGADKTPQWRAGPMGPKTLCNACGVRFKSGRLVPEYRPASSPTFLSQVHSNSHRKIIEMRRKRQCGMSPVKPVDKG